MTDNGLPFAGQANNKMKARTARLALVSLLVFGSLGQVSAQGWVGDWQLVLEAEDTPFERRVAVTPSVEFSGGEPEAIFGVRRMKPDEPVHIVVVVTTDPQEKTCDFDDWELAIDSEYIDVAGYAIGPGVAAIEATDATRTDELWGKLRTGSKVAVRVVEECGWLFGDKAMHVFTFSLRGSNAAIGFVSERPR